MDAQQPQQDAKKPALDPAAFYVPGTFAERVDLQLGLLTQGVADCMILATGAMPGLTEGAPEQPAQYYPHRPPAPNKNDNAWQAARSAELRDAARLSEASARLLMGFARLRGEFKQDFTVRHTDDRAASEDGRRSSTVVIQKFSVPKDPDARADGDGEPALGAEIAAQFGKTMAAMAERRNAAPDRPADVAATAEIKRKLMETLLRGRSERDQKDLADAIDPPPSAQS